MNDPKNIDEQPVEDEQAEIDEADAIWDALFADPRSDKLLKQLAEEARKADREGRTISLDSLECED